MKKRLITIIKIFSITAVIGIGYAEIWRWTGFGIPCVFHKITGLKCPGCGMTHMFISLLHWDFKEAFLQNRVVFVLLPFLFAMICFHSIQYIRYGKKKIGKIENSIYYFLISLLIIWGIVRNLILW